MKKVIMFLLSIISTCFLAALAYAESAAGGGTTTGGITDIGSVAQQVTGSFVGVAHLITAGSYVAGAGLTVAGVFKLKAHKENPTQVQLSQGIVLIILGAILVFLPTIIGVAGQTLFSDSAVSGSVKGTSSFVTTKSGG